MVRWFDGREFPPSPRSNRPAARYAAGICGLLAFLSLVGFGAAGVPVREATPKDDGFSLVPSADHDALADEALHDDKWP
jgi:hypothetical protein